MKIVIDARMYGLEHSGIGRYIINLVQQLQRIGSSHKYSILLKKKYFNELVFPENWKKVLADFRHYTIKEQLKLPSLIKKENPDLVHFPHINIPMFYSGVFLTTIHDMTMHRQGMNATTLPVYRYLFKRIPYKLVFNKAVIKSKRIITPSETVKAEIVNYFKIDPERIIVTYEGFNINYIIGKAGSRELEILSKYKLANLDYFFYVGNTYPHKNIESAIYATIDLNKNKDVKVKFVIAGSKDFFVNRLQRFVDKNEANDYIKLLGFVTEEELRILYKYSTGFIYPSLSEGFGLQGLEAIASGTMLLASDIPIFKEIFGSHAFYFNPNSVESISSTMYSVLRMTRDDKFKYVEIAQEFIKKYSWEKMAQKTLEIYKHTFQGDERNERK